MTLERDAEALTQQVAEVETQLDGLPVFRQAEWAARFTGLVQGLTGRVPRLEFDRSRRGISESTSRHPEAAAADGWERLRTATGIARLAHRRQVHGARVAVCREADVATAAGDAEADALVTACDGLLLAVTVADCVPVFAVDPERRLLGLAHAGWRGMAAGVVEATLAALAELGAERGSLRVHLGPAICGRCYEVGPEVLAALGDVPADARRVDLRAVIARRALAAGVGPGRLTVSRLCTRCDRRWFFSYRGGDRGQRMCAFLGWSPG